MRLRSFLALLAVPPVLLLGASCVAFPFGAADGFGSSGGGGAPFTTESTGTGVVSGGEGGSSFDTSTSTGAGGSVNLSPDAGFYPGPSFSTLCGGAQAACVPGAHTDTCAQGGNPGMGGGPAATDAGAVSCQLVGADGGAGNGGDGGDGGSALTAQCGVSGLAADGEPCMSGADCAPDLGCIAGTTPICRSYCCAGAESCPAQTYCVTAAMNEAPGSAIPICIPTHDCQLLNDTASCPAGLTCAIVRASGTRSCVVPGTSTTGGTCPCAAGYTCSAVDNTCLQLCHTSGTDCGSEGFCQGGTAPYPSGIGYCVSY